MLINYLIKMSSQYLLIPLARAAETNTINIDGTVINIRWWPYLYFTVQYFLMFLTVIYIIGIILVLIRTQRFRVNIKEAVAQELETGRLSKTKIRKDWDAIITDIESDDPDDYKEAVIVAERLFDNILKSAKFAGENLEVRLRRVPDSQLEFKEDVIWAHKLRNNIAGNVIPEVDHEEARRAIYIFQRALKEIGAL